MNTVPTTVPTPVPTHKVEYVNIDDVVLTAEYTVTAELEGAEGRHTATIAREALEAILHLAGFRAIGQ